MKIFLVFHGTDSAVGIIESARAINIASETWTGIILCGVPTWSVEAFA